MLRFGWSVAYKHAGSRDSGTELHPPSSSVCAQPCWHRAGDDRGPRFQCYCLLHPLPGWILPRCLHQEVRSTCLCGFAAAYGGRGGGTGHLSRHHDVLLRCAPTPAGRACRGMWGWLVCVFRVAALLTRFCFRGSSPAQRCVHEVWRRQGKRAALRPGLHRVVSTLRGRAAAQQHPDAAAAAAVAAAAAAREPPPAPSHCSSATVSRGSWASSRPSTLHAPAVP